MSAALAALTLPLCPLADLRPLLQDVSSTVRTTMRTHSTSYQSLATAYAKLSKASFKEAILSHQEQLKRDSLMGLAKQALVAIDKHRIRQLTEVCDTVCHSVLEPGLLSRPRPIYPFSSVILPSSCHLGAIAVPQQHSCGHCHSVYHCLCFSSSHAHTPTHALVTHTLLTHALLRHALVCHVHYPFTRIRCY